VTYTKCLSSSKIPDSCICFSSDPCVHMSSMASLRPSLWHLLTAHSRFSPTGMCLRRRMRYTLYRNIDTSERICAKCAKTPYSCGPTVQTLRARSADNLSKLCTCTGTPLDLYRKQSGCTEYIFMARNVGNLQYEHVYSDKL